MTVAAPERPSACSLTVSDSMKIATWSVNGVNRRLQYLQHWLRKRQPDVVALQKIRVSGKRRGNFPRKVFEDVGYRVEELLADHELASVAVLVRQGFLQTNGHRELKVRQRGWPVGRRMAGCSRWMRVGPKLRPSTRPLLHVGTARGTR